MLALNILFAVLIAAFLIGIIILLAKRSADAETDRKLRAERILHFERWEHANDMQRILDAHDADIKKRKRNRCEWCGCAIQRGKVYCEQCGAPAWHEEWGDDDDDGQVAPYMVSGWKNSPPRRFPTWG
jgi:hypothetical protein